MRMNNLATPARFVAPPQPLGDRLVSESTSILVDSAELQASGDCSATLALTAQQGVKGLELHVAAVADGILRLRVGTPGAVRTRSAQAHQLLQDLGEYRGSVAVQDGRVTVTTSSLSAEVDLNPFMIRIKDPARGTVFETLQQDLDATGTRRSLPLGVTLGSSGPIHHLTVRVHPDDAFYGLGESFRPIDKRGSHSVMWTCDAYGTGSDRMYKPVPYLYCSAGYALLVDTGLPVEFDIASSSNAALSLLCPDDVLDCYVIAGPSAAESLQRSRALTGSLVAPPRWALGGWMSTGFLPQTQESVLARAEELRERDFPCDVLHIDPYWMRPGTWCDLEWDRETFPDPVAMLARLRELGLRTCLWINPYVSEASPVFTGASAAGYFLRREDGSTWTGEIWGDDVPHPPVAVVDFTNPAARAWYGDRLRSRLREGVALFKTDFGEAVPHEAYTAEGLDGTALHNVYPLLYNELVADVTEEVTGDRVVWGRSSYLGGQRHVAQWGGDTPATWEGMANTLRGGLSYSMSGYSFWSHDVGGFSGRPAPELFRAWAAWGALSPLTRLHGTSSRIPWEWDEETLASITASMELRYTLMPHLYSLTQESVRLGLPMVRPMPLACPDEPSVRDADSCFLLGEDIVVAPVRDEAGSHLAYLPAGRWIEFSGGEEWDGGRWIARTAPSGVPAFVRAGAVIPTTPGLRRVPEGPFTHVILQLWAPRDRDVLITDVDGGTTVTVGVVDGVVELAVDGPLDVVGVELRAAPQVSAVRYRGTEYRTGADNGNPTVLMF